LPIITKNILNFA